jgi:hypothetical protein
MSHSASPQEIIFNLQVYRQPTQQSIDGRQAPIPVAGNQNAYFLGDFFEAALQKNKGVSQEKYTESKGGNWQDRLYGEHPRLPSQMGWGQGHQGRVQNFQIFFFFFFWYWDLDSGRLSRFFFFSADWPQTKILLPKFPCAAGITGTHHHTQLEDEDLTILFCLGWP